MEFSFNIAIAIPMLEHESRLLGHLWHRTKSGSASAHWGQQYPDLEPVFSQQTKVHKIGTHKFAITTKSDRERTLKILSGVLNAFGAADLDLSKSKNSSFALEVELTDYVRPSITRAAIGQLFGRELPINMIKGGHWFVCYAQHQASKGTINLKYSKKGGFDLAVELQNKGDHSLTMLNGSNTEQLFSFTAEQPLVFGVSLQHVWESNGCIANFGSEHKNVRFVEV